MFSPWLRHLSWFENLLKVAFERYRKRVNSESLICGKMKKLRLPLNQLMSNSKERVSNFKPMKRNL